MRTYYLFFSLFLSVIGGLVCQKSNNGYPQPPYESGNYLIAQGDSILFIYQPELYRQELSGAEKVYVAGSFNRWAEAKYRPWWYMKYNKTQRIYELKLPKDSVMVVGQSGYPEFKFVIFPTGWQVLTFIPQEAQRNGNLWINWDQNGDYTPPVLIRGFFADTQTVQLHFNEPLNQERLDSIHIKIEPPITINKIMIGPDSQSLIIHIEPFQPGDYAYISPYILHGEGIQDRQGNAITHDLKLHLPYSREMLQPFFAGLPLTSSKLGLEIQDQTVICRLFGPRLTGVSLELFNRADSNNPDTVIELKRSKEDPAIWNGVTPLECFNQSPYYQFRIYKHDIEEVIADPYAQAMFYSSGKSIFTGQSAFEWGDNEFETPLQKDLIIYETHPVNFTYENPVVKPEYRGKFLAFTQTEEGSPTRHLTELGINAVEFMPFSEIGNGSSPDVRDNYDWGYMPAFYFTPESDYIVEVEKGQHIKETQQMIDALHRQGIAVILDVVYNHTTNVDNCLRPIDEEYFYTGGNLSGCGNDLDCERPYVQKLIIDNLIFWIKEMHIDGFRFDISHLINQEKLLTRETIQLLNNAKPTRGPVSLILENWANDRMSISGRGIAQWNDQFRERVKTFLAKEKDNYGLYASLNHSFDKPWFVKPLESLNYLESHDEESLVNFLEEFHSDHSTIMQKAKMGGLIMMISAGVPMLLEGQEMGRNKIKQTQDIKSNVIDWNLKQKNLELFKFYKEMIAFRKKHELFRPLDKYPENSWTYDENQPDGLFVGDFHQSKEKYKLILNNRPDSVTLEFDTTQEWNIVCDNQGVYSESAKSLPQNEHLTLTPYQFYFLRKK